MPQAPRACPGPTSVSIPGSGVGCLLVIRDPEVELTPRVVDPVFDSFSDHVFDPHFCVPNGPLDLKSVKK